MVTTAATVVVTNYNYDQYVIEAVQSARDQTVDCQVIVVDDGSTDRSLELLEDFVAAYPDVQLLAKENGGQASAMNVGWEAAVGPVVFFLDGDDLLEPDAVERVVGQLATDPSAVRCQFRLRWIDAQGGPLEGQFPEADRQLPAGDFRQAMTVNPDDIAWQPTSGNAFTAAGLNQFMPIPEAGYRISADHYLSNISPLYGPVLAVEAPLGAYRVHGANADHRSDFDTERLRSILIRTAETRQHVIDHGRALNISDMPRSVDGFRSLTTAGLRLISYRRGRSGDGQHPFAADTKLGLVRRGVGAAFGRQDFSLAKRLAATAWVLAVAAAPAKLVPALAARGLTR